MKIIFGTDNQIGSLAIRLKTWSNWSHVGVVLNDDVVEATASHGVVKSTLEDFKSRYPKHKIVNIHHKGDYQQRVLSQVGKPYDWGAIFKFMFRGDWDDTDKWFCFELAAYASGIYNSEYLDRVTAPHLLMLSEEEL